MLSHRLRKIAHIAGADRVRQIDEILRARPLAGRALLEGNDALRVAESLAHICADIRMERADHAARLVRASLLLADSAGLDDDDRTALHLGCLVHDVGKLAVPDAILMSKAPLAPNDLDAIMMHSSLGHAVLFGAPGLAAAAQLVLHHHEYVNGTGYLGARGDDIPKIARVFVLVDSYEAMVRDDRVFRDGMSHDEARAEIASLAGARYDAALVDAFLHRLDRAAWEAVWRSPAADDEGTHHTRALAA